MALRFSQTAAAILFLFFISPALNAETIYKWTDKSGGIHITNEKPPEDIKIDEVINSPSADKEIFENRIPRDLQRQDYLKQEKIRKAKDSKVRAEKAKEKAEEAKVAAEQAKQKAQEYIKKNAPRNKEKRNVYRKRVKSLIKEAEEAAARANEAIEASNKAVDEAAQAEKEAMEAGDGD